MNPYSLMVAPGEAGARLDKFLAVKLPDLTRSRLQQLIADGQLTRDGTTLTDASRKVKPGEHYVLTLPQAAPLDLLPLDLPLDIIFEDEHLLVINKPVGLTVHPAAGNRDHTLVNALLHHCGDSLSGIGGVMRPGIVHRIDKDTSGLLVVAKNDTAHQHLSAQLKSRILKRTYIAYAWGTPPKTQGTVDAPIARHKTKRKEMAIVEGGRHAVTHYEVLMGFGGREETRPALSPVHCAVQERGAGNNIKNSIAVKLQCNLDTGRTHQIRVHMRHIGCPLIGDATYGLSPKQTLNKLNKASIVAVKETDKVLLTLSRQALHAAKLSFKHPVTGAEILCEAPLPDDLRMLEQALAALTT